MILYEVYVIKMNIICDHDKIVGSRILMLFSWIKFTSFCLSLGVSLSIKLRRYNFLLNGIWCKLYMMNLE